MKGVMAILLNEDNRVLLQLRDDKPDIPNPGKWSVWTGKLEENENPVQGVVREVKEETGLQLKNPQFFCKIYNKNDVENYVFVDRVDVEEEIEVNEGQKGQLFHMDEVEELENITRSTLKVLQYYQKMAMREQLSDAEA